MELTFEVSKQIGTGEYPIVTHLKDNTIVLFYQGGGNLLMKQGEFIADTPNSTILGAETIMSTDFTPQIIGNIRHSGGQNWMNWNSGTKQRAALFPESPYIMKPLFYRGFMAGVYSKEAEEPDLDNTDTIEITPQLLQDFGIDYWNGFVVGRLAYKQSYPEGGAV